MAIPADERTLTPYTYNTGFPGYNILSMIYDTLMLIDADGVPQPWLAESVEVSDDGLTWTFTLREGIRWQDGEPLTSADVQFTYEYFQQNAHGRFTPEASVVSSISAPDERTVVMTLDAPNPIFDSRTLADVPILPKHIWEGVEDPNAFDNALGSGPYKLVKYVPDQFYRLEENPDYFAGEPVADLLILPIIKDPTSTFSALKAGEIDVSARELTPELVEEFENTPGVAVITGPGFASTLVQFNLEREPFDDPAFRRVVAGLIDYQQLVDTLLLGRGTLGSPGFLHPALPFYNENLTGYELLSAEEAAQRLEELGYRDTDGDGVREFPDGRPLEFVFLAQSDNPIRLRAAELISQSLREAGIAFNVRALDRDTIVSLVWPDFDVCKGRDFDVAMWGWSAPVQSRTLVQQLFHSDCRVGTLNIGGYSNERLNELVDQQAVTVNREARKQLLDRVQEIIAEDLPFITLFYADRIFAYRPEAYAEWVFQVGEGIINKLSLVRQELVK
jgi:peptide/nickel transport system substrate-binding protein